MSRGGWNSARVVQGTTMKRRKRRAGVWTFLGRKWGCSPEGTADNSPAVHCREHVGTKRVPKGRLNSIPQILLVDFDPVLLQQRQEFLLERFIAMMLLLLADVANERVQLRHAHVERPIFFLPLEKSVFGEDVVNPLGGTALDQLGSLCDRQGGRKRKEQVNRIFDSTDFDGLHFVLPGDAAHERPPSLTQGWRDEFAPLFCAENQMNMIAHVRHAGIQPSLRDSINSNSSPAVNCRAIFVSPYGRSTGIGTPEFPNSIAGQPARRKHDVKLLAS